MLFDSALEHVPFRGFSRDETLSAYTSVGVKVLLLLLRTLENTAAGSWTIHLPEDIKKNVQLLKTALEQQSAEDSSLELCHKIFLGLWTREWLPSPECKQPDPTVQAVMMTQLQRDGSFKHVRQVTGYFAKLQALMVCTKIH
jgi:hypothetical protein